MSDSVWPHRRQPTRLPRPWDSPGKNTGVGCHFLLQCMKLKSESEVTQSYPNLSDPMDCSLPGSSIHGIFQARVLEWGAIAFSDLILGLLFMKTLIIYQFYGFIFFSFIHKLDLLYLPFNHFLSNPLALLIFIHLAVPASLQLILKIHLSIYSLATL